jgi:hypothetical protein
LLPHTIPPDDDLVLRRAGSRITLRSTRAMVARALVAFLAPSRRFEVPKREGMDLL